ncbi:TetR family transcriptional regulator [Desulfatiferula olefinivorans]
MAPKVRYIIDDILDSAFRIVRSGGLEKLTARSIAEDLKSSTMPIYSCGKSMLEIEEAVIEMAWAVMTDYERKRRTRDAYLDLGLGYVMFAREEPHLFKCLFNRKHDALNRRLAEEHFRENMAWLADYPLFQGISDEAKMSILTHGWIYSHGLADLLVKVGDTMFEGLDTEQDIARFFVEATMMARNGMDRFVRDNQVLMNAPKT